MNGEAPDVRAVRDLGSLLEVSKALAVLVDAPFQSGSDLHAVGDTVGIALPPERALYLAA